MALASKQTVHLAFELPLDWSEPLAAYVKSADERRAMSAFLNQSGWDHLVAQYPDGRTSHAMIALLRYVHSLARAGYPVSAATFDTRPWESKLNSDVGMAAASTRQIETIKADVTYVLAGEFHTRLVENTTPFAPHPMAALVAGARPNWPVLSVVATYSSGSIWGCDGDNKCGAMPQHKGPPLRAAALALSTARNAEGYRGELYVGTVTASPPYKQAHN